MGYGVVGRALAGALRRKGVNPIVYDPPQGEVPSLSGVDVAFICVPTPTNIQTGTVGLGAVRECVGLLPMGATVVIRSTVPPGTTNNIQHQYMNHHVYFVPEFLTEATAMEDALEPTRVIIGVPRHGNNGRPLARVRSLLSAQGVDTVVMDADSAEVAKYAANTFYATKVAFFNELYDLCQATGANYDQVRESVARDPWTGAQHTAIFHGGYRGYGGKCLPKDARAFATYARMMGVPQSILEAAEGVNRKLRGTG